MRKGKQFLCIIIIGTAIVSQINQAVYADGWLDGLKDAASDVIKDETKDAILEIVNESLHEFGIDFWDQWLDSGEDWLGEWSDEFIVSMFDGIMELLEISDGDIIEKLQGAFLIVTTKLGMEGEDAENLWKTIMDFAEENDIDSAVIAKLSIAVIVNAKMEEGYMKDQSQEYIIDLILSWINNSVIINQEKAEEALEEQKNILQERVEAIEY